MEYRRQLFDKYFSLLYKKVMPRGAAEWEWVLDRIELNFGDILSSAPKDSAILDVGCGVGYFEHYLMPRGFTNIHAIDVSPEQIDVAKRKLDELGISYRDRVKFEISDAFECLAETNKYDIILMMDFLEHFPKDKVMELLHLAASAARGQAFLFLRVINADNPLFGRHFYHDFTHETPFTADSIHQCLGLAGFEVIRVAYEKIPMVRGRRGAFRQARRLLRLLGLKLLGGLLGISPAAFSENLVVVAKK